MKIKCYHPSNHRKIPTRNQQSNYSDWLLNQENQSNHNRQGSLGRPVDRVTPPAGFENQLIDPRADPTRQSLGKSVRFNEGQQGPLDHIPDPEEVDVKQPRKIMLPNRGYPTTATDGSAIPEEPEHIQDIMGRNTPPVVPPRWGKDGSLV